MRSLVCSTEHRMQPGRNGKLLHRKRSDLSVLFFRYILQYLFHRWQTKYKEYTENVITHCRRYQNNHNYLTEVSLDIKNFFPSISPKLLYNYIVEKLRPTYSEDLGVLKTAVAKLLYFKISPSDIERWKEYYYPDNFDAANAELYMTCGIPQGLPQSYFFGNLCMINIENILMKEEYFKGDAYFYVDDSVIYVQSALKEDDFKRKIKHLNNDLRAWCIQNEEKESDISLYVSDEYIDFHCRIKYIIEFHENDKSIFTPIDTTENHLGPIANLTRETSISSKLSLNLDEIDDRISLGKLNALNDVISREIEILRHKEKEAGHSDNKVSSRLKLLKRFKKFFLYRNRLLKIRDDGGPNNVLSKDFEKMLSEQIENLQEWFDLSEEDIFQSEYRLLIQKQSKTDATVLSDKVKNFERKIVKMGADIDDDKMTCNLIKKIFEKKYDVVLAHNGQEAIELLKQSDLLSRILIIDEFYNDPDPRALDIAMGLLVSLKDPVTILMFGKHIGLDYEKASENPEELKPNYFLGIFNLEKHVFDTKLINTVKKFSQPNPNILRQISEKYHKLVINNIDDFIRQYIYLNHKSNAFATVSDLLKASDLTASQKQMVFDKVLSKNEFASFGQHLVRQTDR